MLNVKSRLVCVSSDSSLFSVVFMLQLCSRAQEAIGGSQSEAGNWIHGWIGECIHESIHLIYSMKERPGAGGDDSFLPPSVHSVATSNRKCDYLNIERDTIVNVICYREQTREQEESINH